MTKTNRRISPAKRQGLPGKHPAQKRGASESVTGFGDRCRGLLLHHKFLLKDSLRRLLREPWQSLMTALVIAIALGLPGFLYFAVVNLQSVGESVDSTGQITVFLKTGVSGKQIDQMHQQLEQLKGVAVIEYISPEAALIEFKNRSGFGEALDLLEENPLPGVFGLTPASTIAGDVASLQTMIDKIRQFPSVDDVMLDLRWLERLNTFLQIAKNLTYALGLALSLGVLLVVGNTIRLEIENRKDEIIVVKLVGGTDAYVRRPFLYTGFWYGIAGGILAWVLVSAVILSVSGTVNYLAGLYESNYVIEGAGLAGLITLALLGGVLGLLGSFVAVSRHIAVLEPS